jgi:hypothetical protein
MATIEDAVRDQLKSLVKDLLTQDPRLLTGAGISKQRRNYLKSRDRGKNAKKLPPADAVFAALILLRKEITVQGVFGSGREGPKSYSIVALERGPDDSLPTLVPQVQMSLLAGLEFSQEAEATIERAERKGPHRVELQLKILARA